MTQRERTMATVLGGGTIFGVGFFGFLMFYNAFAASGQAIEKITKDTQEAETKLILVQKDAAKLQRWRRLSATLSAGGDIDKIRGAYREYLLSKLTRHGLTSNYSFETPPADSKSSIVVPGKAGSKPPVYIGLNYFVRFKAKMPNLVSFMQDFQSEPKLHRIKALTIERSDDKKDDWLTVQMTVEALLIHDAEKTVNPKQFNPDPAVLKWETKSFMAGGPAGLATLGWSLGPKTLRVDPLNPPLTAVRNYSDIGRQNPFLGFVAVGGEKQQTAKPPSDDVINVMRFNRLVSLITQGEDAEAWLWNPSNNKMMRLRNKLGFDTFPLIQTEKERPVVYGKVVKIQDMDVVFRVTLKASWGNTSRWWRYPETNNFYKVHKDDADRLIKDGVANESDRGDLYLVSAAYWEKLTKKEKGKIEVAKDGKNFRVVGDSSYGTLVFSDAKVTVIRINPWPPGAPLASSVGATRLYPETDAIYNIDIKHFDDLVATKKAAKDDINRAYAMRSDYYNYLRQQRVIRTTGGGGGGGGGKGGTFTFYNDLIYCDIISEANDLVVFKIAEKYCHCFADRDAGIEDHWHEGYCLLRLHGYAQEALYSPLSPARIKEILKPGL